ncbi:hypothetical protein Trydic_g9068, partial [Trypoxylus dichotomus]
MLTTPSTGGDVDYEKRERGEPLTCDGPDSLEDPIVSTIS